jgi:membrane fusion protein, multidrug efflux system
MNKCGLVIMLSASMLTAFGVSSCGNGNAKETSGAAPAGSPANVKIAILHPTVFEDAISLTGIVKALDDVMISPEEGGIVLRWKAAKGSYVRKGDVLGTLKDDLLTAGFDAAQAQYKLAQLNYEKQKNVYADQGISELQLKSSEYNRDAARANADLMKARLDHARIVSPIDGIFDNYFADEGEMAPPGVPIAHVVNLSMVKIAIDVPERHSADVHRGTKAFITPDVYPADTLTGIVSFVGAAISQSNRTLPVEITLANRGAKLKPEMVARVRMIRSLKQQALLIDGSLLQQVDRNKTIVFVERGGKAEERTVVTGGRLGAMVEVLSGLAPGDHIVTAGQSKLVNGQQVTVTQK